MNKPERKRQSGLPTYPNPKCSQSLMVHNGSHRGRPHYHCRSCQTNFGETPGTPLAGLKTLAAEEAQALLMVMRRGSLRATESYKSSSRHRTRLPVQ